MEAVHEGCGRAAGGAGEWSDEPIQYDETGALCGAQPTLGMDVHPGLQLGRARLQETADFLRDFLGRLECIAGSKKGGACPGHLAAAPGTGFTLGTDHYPDIPNR